ncbi:MAG: hypothetical protein ABI789_03460 [Usitatibacter sp.]
MKPAVRIARLRRHLGWKRWAWATGLSVAFAVWAPIQALDINAYWVVPRIILHAPWFILFSYVYICAIAWVESGDGAPIFPLWRYAYAVGAAGAVCIALGWACGPFIAQAPQRIIDGRPRPLPTFTEPVLIARLNGARVALFNSFHAMLAALIYARLRNLRLATRALAEAELGRSEASRKLLASDLDAAHAELEPALVIERLEEIERAYGDDPQGAEERLDELIAFLRGAIPYLRSIPMPERAP